MLDRYLAVETLSLVYLGEFNPSIFHPSWLASKKLIREDEADIANVEVVMNELSRFKIDDWLSFEVTRNRLELKTMKTPYFMPLKDLAVSVFKILGETPIKSVGINNVYDLTLKSKEDYLKFGDVLVPFVNWADILENPRLLNLDIVEEKIIDKMSSRRIIISPSSPDLKLNFGININVNNHFNLPTNSNGLSSVDIINEKCEYCFVASKQLVDNILMKIYS